MDGGYGMSDERNAPRQALRTAVRDLEELRSRLLDLAGSLAPREGDRGGDEPVQTESVLRCVVLDRLDPAIRDLVRAVGSIGGEWDEERSR